MPLYDGFEEHKHDGLLIFVCFFGSAIAGYILMNHHALLGI
jgi:hypothetical protein